MVVVVESWLPSVRVDGAEIDLCDHHFSCLVSMTCCVVADVD